MPGSFTIFLFYVVFGLTEISVQQALECPYMIQ